MNIDRWLILRYDKRRILYSILERQERRKRMNIWHDLGEKRIRSDKFEAFIEIPKGCKYDL